MVHPKKYLFNNFNFDGCLSQQPSNTLEKQHIVYTYIKIVYYISSEYMSK